MRHSQSPIRIIRWGLVLGLGPALAAALMLPCFAQQIHHNGFETNRTSWLKGSGDVPFKETAHDISDEVAHEGKRSEHIQTDSLQGKEILYYYPTGNAPISDDLTISVWVKSNHPGIQLMARVVLPKEADPASLQDRLTTIIRGDAYKKVGQWQRLEILRPVKLAQEQQRLMQAESRRAITFQDAFIDRLVLNVYGGTGVTDVWIDELEIGPVYEMPGARATAPAAPNGAPAGTAPAAAASRLVEFNDRNLQVDGKNFFCRGIQYTDTPLDILRDAGFNTLFVSHPWDAAKLKQMTNMGFMLVPNLSVTSDDARLVSADTLTRDVRDFPEPANVLFFNLGTALSYEQASLVGRIAPAIRAVDRQRAQGLDAWDGLSRYSTMPDVGLVSVHRWPLMTTLELLQYKDWLQGRSRLTKPGTFMWTWIQTHTPDFFTQVLYQKPSSAVFDDPIGPQPEQVRLLTYLAIGSGFRGIGYWSDRFLAEDHKGTDRLLTVALLNQELEFLDPLLSCADGYPQWIDTNDVNVKAAVLRTPKGILVLPMWLGGSAQFVPAQEAAAKLTLTVPSVGPSFQCWEVTPGEVRSLKEKPGGGGGMEITLPEFGLTTAIVFTSDVKLIQLFQERSTARREQAARFTYDLAVQELKKTAIIEQQLEKMGHTLSDSPQLMNKADVYLKSAKFYFDKRQFTEAYREAQRALRPARILMRAQWEAAITKLETPVASPWAVSFYTLPRHWEFMDQVKGSKFGDNLIKDGDFEIVPGRKQEEWYPQESTLDDVEMRAERVTEVSMATTDPKTKKDGKRGNLGPKQGKQFLLLTIKPKSKDLPVPKALERTFLSINSPWVTLPPGTLVRVSGWMCVPDPIQASPDGALFFDSAGSEPLAVRLTGRTDGWKHFTLYRTVPETGMIKVTLAMTGLGRVAFDDVKIEAAAAK